MKKFLVFVLFFIAIFASKVEISAENVVASNQKGVTDFKGNVTIIKGKDIMRADVVQVFVDKEKNISKIYAYGKASFYVVPKENLIFKGNADSFTYYPQKKEIVLKGKAVIEDLLNNRKIIGEEVLFNEETQLANISGNKKEPVKVIFDIQDKQ